MGRSTEGRTRLSERRKYRSWTAKQKVEIVLAGVRGDRSVKEVCREHESRRRSTIPGGKSCFRAAGRRSRAREEWHRDCVRPPGVPGRPADRDRHRAPVPTKTWVPNPSVLPPFEWPASGGHASLGSLRGTCLRPRLNRRADQCTERTNRVHATWTRVARALLPEGERSACFAGAAFAGCFAAASDVIEVEVVGLRFELTLLVVGEALLPAAEGGGEGTLTGAVLYPS